MGGTSIAAMAERMTVDFSEGRELTFVPGRGGIGEAIAIQANTICSMMAEKTGGESHALYTPDQITPETYSYLAAEPSVNQVLNLLDEAEVLILGIGDAHKMAARRNVSPEIEAKLRENDAVGEALGQYFDEDGECIHELSKIGMSFEDLEHIKIPLAVAGGKEKAKAILAFLKNVPKNIHLVTDEGAVNEILRLMDFQ
jgi:central glycolytic genes regulator